MRQAFEVQPVSPHYLERGVDSFRARLRERAMKLPKVREAVARCALKQTGQFTALDLVRALRAEGNSEAHAVTVYRTMPLLVDAGLLRTALIPRGDSQHYEVAFERATGPQLACRTCGTLLEFQSATLAILQREIAKRYGFDLEVAPLHGRCYGCRSESP
jgi:Fur family transcriptional regulator, ferric uptake regulator